MEARYGDYITETCRLDGMFENVVEILMFPFQFTVFSAPSVLKAN